MTAKPAPTDAMAGILAGAKALHRVGAIDAVELAQIKNINDRKADVEPLLLKKSGDAP